MNLDDVKEFDTNLKTRIARFRTKLRDWLAPHKLTVAQTRVHKVLIPMAGVYTPGWQALPAVSWEFLELVTHEGLTGTGEWPISIDERTRIWLEQLATTPQRNLLDLECEEPLFMVWWDLVGKVLDKPLHVLWGELFECPFTPPKEVPMAAYTWQRFPDIAGKGAVTFETWPAVAAELARKGFPSIKVSMTAYQPEDHIELIHNIRSAVGHGTDIRVDAHGTWNFQEARRILHAVEACNLEYIEQPVNALLPYLFYPKGELVPRAGSDRGFQAEYYFRRMTELRREVRTPLSCHWWTPPIIQPPGETLMSNRWEPNWYLLEKYEAADVSVPDIGLGIWGLWRLTQLAKFLGMHVTVHSNFELCLQLSFRAAMVSALVYDSERAGLYLGKAPRLCHPIDNETIAVSDDVIEGGQFNWSGGHLRLSDLPGHGLKLDPQRLQCYKYTPETAAKYALYARQLYENYVLDRPRRTNQAGWPKRQQNERFDFHTFPYQLTDILGIDEDQDVDTKLNR